MFHDNIAGRRVLRIPCSFSTPEPGGGSGSSSPQFRDCRSRNRRCFDVHILCFPRVLHRSEIRQSPPWRKALVLRLRQEDIVGFRGGAQPHHQIPEIRLRHCGAPGSAAGLAAADMEESGAACAGLDRIGVVPDFHPPAVSRIARAHALRRKPNRRVRAIDDHVLIVERIFRVVRAAQSRIPRLPDLTTMPCPAARTGAQPYRLNQRARRLAPKLSLSARRATDGS